MFCRRSIVPALAGIAVLFALAGSAAASPTEQVLERAFLPSERNVQGEFRLVRRGSAWVAQTLLDTTSLRRAVQKIRKKELARWRNVSPPSDSSLYLEALEASRSFVLDRAPAPSGRRQLMIEVEAAPEHGALAFFAVRLERRDGAYFVGERELIERLVVSPEYARDSVGVQAVEAFGTAPEPLLENR